MPPTRSRTRRAEGQRARGAAGAALPSLGRQRLRSRCRRRGPLGPWTSSNAISSSRSRCRWRSCSRSSSSSRRTSSSRPSSRRRSSRRARHRSRAAPPAPATPAPAPGMSGTPIANAAPRDKVLAETPARSRSRRRALNGSVALKGARLDDLTLVNYRETVDPNSPEIVLLAPDGTEEPYFVELGWVAGRCQGQRSWRRHAMDQRRRHARARSSARAQLGQRRRAHLHAPHRRRSRLHVHGDADGREPHRRAGDALSLQRSSCARARCRCRDAIFCTKARSAY